MSDAYYIDGTIDNLDIILADPENHGKLSIGATELRQLAVQFKSIRAENEKLRANFTMLADAVRVAKEAASYNRHKNEHCISRSIWSALSDQEKYARKALAEIAAAALKEAGE